MARLTDEDRKKIIADFHIGKSQNQLAKDYSVSPATINKLCKGVIPKYKDKVNTMVSIKAELVGESEYQSECFNKEVNTQLRRMNLVYGLTEKALKKIGKSLDYKVDETQENGTIKKVDFIHPSKDLKEYVDAIDKASITLGLNQRHANSQVTVNTQNTIQSNHIELTEEQAKSKALELGVPLSVLE